MSQSWGRNLGLAEQKLDKKARFTYVASAFDSSCHPNNGSSDQPVMCGIVPFALRLQLLPRSSRRQTGWQATEKGIGSVGDTWPDVQLIRCSDDSSPKSHIARKCLWLTNRAFGKRRQPFSHFLTSPLSHFLILILPYSHITFAPTIQQGPRIAPQPSS